MTRAGSIRVWFIAAILAVAGIPPRSSLGQAQLRDFAQPFVVLDGGGHSGPVQSLLFTSPDGTGLISGGLDKVVRVWVIDQGRVRLSRTIRPPAWRGRAGAIYAMALSTNADANGQRLLAVGGYGVSVNQGDIGLYRFPGSPAKPLGDLVARLPNRNPADPAPFGHGDVVTGLAITPDGRFLVSAGNDGRVLLWDLATFRVVADLLQLNAPVTTMAMSGNGRRLAVGGRDGVVRLVDLDRRALIAQRGPVAGEQANPPDPLGDMVTHVAISPDARLVVIGRENGRLTRYEGDTLANPAFLQRAGERLGAIEGLAFSPDGFRLAVSAIREVLPNGATRPRPDCDVQIRRMPDGALEPASFAADSLVQALSFSPDGRFLAYSGGEDQAIVLRDLRDAARKPLVLKGEGTTIRDVAFGDDRKSIRLTRPDGEAVAFDIPALNFRPADGVTWGGALTTWQGWRVQPIGPHQLRVISPQDRAFDIPLNEMTDRRWWAYSFLPGGPGHAKPTIAVACDMGIVVYRLEDGQRTRFLNGHLGPVYTLAPSPDGRWLVTGSVDQTAKLWRLAGCDERPALGATSIPNPAGEAVVTAVEARGFADAMGLQVGDVVEVLGVGRDRRVPIDFAKLAAEPPGVVLGFQIRRGAERIFLNTTRRDSPMLSIFVGEDREWVAWMPQGFYQTSVAGDRRYLGWHKNNVVGNAATDTDHFSAEKFDAELRRPQVLRALFEGGGDLGLALRANDRPDLVPVALVERQGPPIVGITEPADRPADRPLTVPGATVPIHVRAAAEGRELVGRLRVLVNGRAVAADRVFNPPVPVGELDIDVPLTEGRQKVVVEGVNAQGKKRAEGFDVISLARETKKPTLYVLSVGLSGPFQGRSPKIAYAQEDARDLGRFLLKPAGRQRFPEVADLPPMIGPAATSRDLRGALKRLELQVADPSDTLIVAMETHLVVAGKDRFLVAADTGAVPTSADATTAEEVGDALARIASRGGKVLLLLDTVHAGASRESVDGLEAWVRSLSRRNVIVFVASNDGPSQRFVAGGHGTFAQGILDTFTTRAQSRSWLDPALPLSLDDFQDSVCRRVQELSRRRQFASCYIPETLSPATAIFEPERPPLLAEKK